MSNTFVVDGLFSSNRALPEIFKQQQILYGVIS